MSTTTAGYCARHPKEETALTCASCSTPICPKCMVSTPVGMKCPECGTCRGATIFKIGIGRLFIASLTAVIAGVVAGMLGEIGFLVIFIGAAYGYFAGNVILRAAGMKRGLKLEIATVAGMVVGALALKLLPWIIARVPAEGGLTFGPNALIDPYFWLAVVITTSCAVSKVRYF